MHLDSGGVTKSEGDDKTLRSVPVSYVFRAVSIIVAAGWLIC